MHEIYLVRIEAVHESGDFHFVQMCMCLTWKHADFCRCTHLILPHYTMSFPCLTFILVSPCHILLVSYMIVLFLERLICFPVLSRRNHKFHSILTCSQYIIGFGLAEF